MRSRALFCIMTAWFPSAFARGNAPCLIAGEYCDAGMTDGLNGQYNERNGRRGRRYEDGKPSSLAARLNRLFPRRVRWRRLIPALLCLTLAVFGAVKLIGYLADSQAARRSNETVRALYAATEDAPAPEQTPVPEQTPAPAERPTLRSEYQYIGVSVLTEIRRLMNKNGDTAAWLRVPGVVDLPVMYRDNTYYLTHDFYGKISSAGALFLDEAHPLTARTQHLVIHGHNMQNGDMFGLLSHYRRLDYIAEHGIVSLTTRYRAESYAVFAVLTVPDDVNAKGYFPYMGAPTYQSEAQFDAFIDKILAGSIYWIPIDVDASDALLTLSTCADDGHLLIVCRRFRDGETEQTMAEAYERSSVK